MSPLISILIPTLNRAGYLAQAIDSVLAQDYGNLEVIVADNASEDNTSEVVASYLSDSRLRYVRRPENIGMVNNWREALYSDCRGDWFVVLSDDDYLTDKQYLSKAAALIERHPSVLIVYAGGIIHDIQSDTQTELKLPFPDMVSGKTVFLSRNTVNPQDFTLCNILFNRPASLALNPFSDPQDLTCDSELFLKLALHGDVGVINEPVSVYRTTGSNNLLKVMRVPELIIHGCNSIISAYLHAQELNAFSAEELSAWRYRVLDNILRIALRRLRRNAPDRQSEFFEYVYDRSPELLWVCSRHYPFKVGLQAWLWFLRRKSSPAA